MTIAVRSDFGSGGAGLSPNGSRIPSLATILRGLISDILGLAPAAPAWLTGKTVTANAVTLTTAGFVVAVHATAGTSAGPKAQLSTGTPGAGQVTVTYSAAGIPTLTFASADGITACAVAQLPYAAPSVVLG